MPVRPGPSSFSAASSSAAGRATSSAPSAMPSDGGRDGDERGLDRLLGGDPARAEAERALDAEAGQAALDVGVRARGEHRPRREQRDERERDEQRDHDPRGLGQQDLHARAGDELELAEAERDRARLGERHVGLRRVGEPQQRDVRPHAPAVLGPRHVDASGARRAGTRRCRARRRSRSRAACPSSSTEIASPTVHVPLARDAALDHDLAGTSPSRTSRPSTTV